MRLTDLIWKTRVAINLIIRGLWYPIHWFILRYNQSVRRQYAKQAFSWWHKKAQLESVIETYYYSQLAHRNEAVTEAYLWRDGDAWILTRVFGPRNEIVRFYQKYKKQVNLKIDSEKIPFSRWVGIWTSDHIHGWVKCGYFEAPAPMLPVELSEFTTPVDTATFNDVLFAIRHWYVNEIAYKRKVDDAIYFTTIDELMRQYYFTKAIYREVYDVI